MEYVVEQVSAATQKEMVEFLLKHEDCSLFLLGNYEMHGFTMTDAPYSGNFQIVRKNGAAAAVFCLAKRGNLLITAGTADRNLFGQILKACQGETIRGVLGDWKICAPLWDFLKEKKIVRSESFADREVLYSTDCRVEEVSEADVRFLTECDYPAWRALRIDYLQELNLPYDLTEAQMKEQFCSKCALGYSWGLFWQGALVSIADLNAKALDLGQLGGVYTPPQHRRHGFSKALLQHLMRDCRTVHGLRKLIIFTGEENIPARRLYESLKVRRVGEFAMFFS